MTATLDARSTAPDTRGSPPGSTGDDDDNHAGGVAPPRFRPDVQGLRGLAVILVVAFHAGMPVSGGFIGVDVFFVISGFVISLGLHRELRTTGTISLRRFTSRRIKRLFPAFAAFSVVTLVLSNVLVRGDVARQALAETARAASLLAANLQLATEGGGYFAPTSERNPFLHTWSLSIEEQVYLVLPALLLLAWKTGRTNAQSTGRLKLAVAAISLASFAWAAATVASGDVRFAFYGTHLRAWEFGLGVLLALNIHRLDGLSKRTAQGLLSMGAVGVLGAAVFFDDAMPFPGAAALIPTLGAAFLIAGGTAAGAPPTGLRSAPLVWLGDRSYGWYLWHWPAIVFAELRFPDVPAVGMIAGVAALIPTVIGYRLIEQPIRYDARITGVAVVVVALVAIQVPVATASITSRNAELALEPLDGQFGAFTVAWDAGCTGLPFDEATCTFPVEGATGTVLVVGDSHATALTDVIGLAAAQLDLTMIVSTEFGCPAAPRGVLDGGIDGGDTCVEYQEHVRALEQRLDPTVVVVVQRSPYYLLAEVGPGRPILDAAGEPIDTEARALQEWDAAMRELLTEIDGPVVLIATVPEYPEAVRDHIAAGRTNHPDTVQTLDDVALRRGNAMAVEARVAADVGNVVIVDPVSVLCDRECRARVDDVWWYHDDHHLRASATIILGEVIRRGLIDALRGRPGQSND